MSHTMFQFKVLPHVEKGTPLFFILIDNLRFDQWKAIQPIFAESFRILEEDSFYAILPTATQYARNAIFAGMMNEEPGFRAFVLRTFARRMSDVTRLLEQVAFGRVEARLAAALLELQHDGLVQATQGDLAARIGSAREVVSRRLESFHRQGWVETDRGQVRLLDPGALRALVAAPL